MSIGVSLSQPVGWVERSETHHVRGGKMGFAALNPSYTLRELFRYHRDGADLDQTYCHCERSDAISARLLRRLRLLAMAIPANRPVLARIEDRLIVALDLPEVEAARAMAERLDGVVSFFKLGLWLIFAPGFERL